MPLPNSRRAGLYDADTGKPNKYTGNVMDEEYTGVVAAFLTKLKHSQDVRCAQAKAYRDMLGFDKKRCGKPFQLKPQLVFINLRPGADRYAGLCEIIRFAIDAVAPGPLPDCEDLGKHIIGPILRGEFPDIHTYRVSKS